MSALENVSQEDLKNPDYVPPLQVGLVLFTVCLARTGSI